MLYDLTRLATSMIPSSLPSLLPLPLTTTNLLTIGTGTGTLYHYFVLVLSKLTHCVQPACPDSVRIVITYSNPTVYLPHLSLFPSSSSKWRYSATPLPNPLSRCSSPFSENVRYGTTQRLSRRQSSHTRQDLGLLPLGELAFNGQRKAANHRRRGRSRKR